MLTYLQNQTNVLYFYNKLGGVMAEVLEVNEQNFEAEVLKSDKLTVVDFWAPWCGYCIKLSPVIEQISQDMTDVKFVKCNTDDCSNIANDYAISGLPCLLIFKNGEPQDRLVGAMPKSNIVSSVQKYL